MSLLHRLATLALVCIVTALPTAALAAAPSNDTRDGATVVDALPYSAAQDIEEATTDESDPAACVTRPGRTVWYRYSAQEDARLVASTAGSAFGTEMEVFEASGASMSSVGCARGGSSPAGSVIAFPVVSGRTYLFMVGWSHYYSPEPEPGAWQLRFSLREQATFDVDLHAGGFVSSRTGRLTVTGAAVCSEPVSMRIGSQIVQGSGDNRRAAAGTSYVDCGPAPATFELRLGRAEDGLRAGAARLRAYIHIPEQGVRTRQRRDISLTSCTRVGTVGDDVLRGTSGADRICGLHGDDEIVTGGGNDVVYAGPGDDLVRLGSGSDWAAGGTGRDRLAGGRGYDRCIGGAGRDTYRSCEVRRR